MIKYLSVLLFLFLTFFNAQTFPLNTRLIEPSQTNGNFSTAYLKHLNSNKDEVFYSVMSNSDNNDYFGQNINAETRIFSRLRADGIPLWTAKFESGYDKVEASYSNKFLGDVDQNDNLYFLCSMKKAAKFVDADGTTTNISLTSATGVQNILLKLNGNGKLIWYKKIEVSANVGASLKLDNNYDVWLVGFGGQTIDGYNIQDNYYVKLDKNNGNVLFAKNFGNSSPSFFTAHSMNPVFDNHNSLYIFMEPIKLVYIDYVIDGFTIPSSISGEDYLMLKFDSAGNFVTGKNFYANSTNDGSCWFSDVQFDGSNLVALGVVWSNNSPNYFGLDGVQIPKKYEDFTYGGLISKITLDGNVLWQKVIHSNNTSSFGTNMELDDDKNLYSAFYFNTKVTFDGVEYNFDQSVGEKVVCKFDHFGTLKYLKSVDKGLSNFGSYGTGRTYGHLIDLFGNDSFNLSAFTAQNNFLNYPLYNQNIPKNYIATFGDLNSKYLSPQRNYLELTNAGITNNPDNANSFSFNLVNNVNWTANSDQSWLTLSYAKLSQKVSPANTISDQGDAKITLTAETNTSGAARTANVIVSGDGNVAPKTIIVTQSATLKTGASQTFLTTIYPNPTADVLNIQTEQKISKIEVYDMSGKLLDSVDGKGKKVTVSSLTKGMYYIKLYTESGVINSKFIKN
ncbi:T9SS type A sorting domain-containing protein [Chryseobacterium koreense]|uniref:T9SS type A sorting domain-containing protein n=1 Tax=Chryseobacterium koreense TaxID=232216 RepID=UPI0026EB78AA|nr:T9SS type A sorting domain-containing protein [Chryseobacterium koreense]